MMLLFPAVFPPLSPSQWMGSWVTGKPELPQAMAVFQHNPKSEEILLEFLLASEAT